MLSRESLLLNSLHQTRCLLFLIPWSSNPSSCRNIIQTCRQFIDTSKAIMPLFSDSKFQYSSPVAHHEIVMRPFHLLNQDCSRMGQSSSPLVLFLATSVLCKSYWKMKGRGKPQTILHAATVSPAYFRHYPFSSEIFTTRIPKSESEIMMHCNWIYASSPSSALLLL